MNIERELKPCPFCGGKPDLGSYWNARPIEDDAVKYEPTSYSCRACKNATDEEIARLREALEVILDSAQKDEPCILAIKAVAYMALKGGEG